MSQDHLELLFACIRGKNGFNNNPDIVQFKSSLRKILLRNSIIGSKHANCLTFENESAGSIFSLKWNKRNAPAFEVEEMTPKDTQYVSSLVSGLESCSLSSYKEAILGYIAGFVVKKIINRITCTECARALLLKSKKSSSVHDHNYSHFQTTTSLSLISLKNRGGLVLPSNGVTKIIFASERAFQVLIHETRSKKQKISSRRNLKTIMVHLINQELAEKSLFPELNEHDVDHEAITEDLHSSQLIKQIIEKYINLRLSTYGKQYNKDILHKNKIGVRQQSTKLVLFQGI